MAGYTSVIRVYGEDGAKLELDADGSKLHVTLIDGRRVLEAGFDAGDVFEALFTIVIDNPRLLMAERPHGCGYSGCSVLHVPSLELIAHVLIAIREVLSKAPQQPVVSEDDDGMPYTVWSRDEAMAARKAAILLDIVAMLLRNPREMLQRLPRDAELLVNRSVNAGLNRYIVPRSAAEAEKKKNSGG